jgi:hypothetical protein
MNCKSHFISSLKSATYHTKIGAGHKTLVLLKCITEICSYFLISEIFIEVKK